VTQGIAWVSAWAASKGLRYEAEADERWIRVWEPFVTLRTPHRYEHALLGTGGSGSITIARMVVEAPGTSAAGEAREAAAWIALVQDERLVAVSAAATCDAGRVFGEPLDLVTMPRRATGDAPFDRAFASFAPTTDDLARAVTPSVRKLTLSWRVPLHFEVRPGGFIVAPVALGADAQSLSWLLGAVQFFGEKAAKRVQ
jgi:hypothetical protein